MEEEQTQQTKEEIYSCIKCNFPLSSSLSVRTSKNNYLDILQNLKVILDTNNSKCIFIHDKNIINNAIGNKYCFYIDFEKEKILCHNDHEVVGYIQTIKDDDFSGAEIIFGYLYLKNIEIIEVDFQLKKEIPVYSQEEYTVLAKLKQLRYYVKQLTPTLKNSMELIKEERRNIFECDDKFEKYKLNSVINKCKEIKNHTNHDEKDNKKDK